MLHDQYAALKISSFGYKHVDQRHKFTHKTKSSQWY